MQEFNLSVNLPDDKVKQITIGEGMQLSGLAGIYQDYFKDQIILAVFDGKLRELTKKVDHDGTLSFVTTAEADGKRAYRRSMVLLLQKAVEKVFGQNALLRVRHSLGEGYYCEIYTDSRKNPDAAQMIHAGDRRFCKVTQEDLDHLTIAMEILVNQDLTIKKHHTSTDRAEEIFHQAGMPDKEKLFYFRRSSRTNLYELDGTYDYFYGYMAESTGILKYFALELYENSFVLLFPGKNSRRVDPLSTSYKLFHTLEDSREWSRKLNVGTIGALNTAISQGRGQELILLAEGRMEEQIGNIAAVIASDEQKKFVMIAGPSSSGKTSFANRLSIQLKAKGKIPHPVSLDDYYVNRVDNPKNPDGSYDYECLEALDIRLFNKNMLALLNGETIDMPTYNFKTGMREYRGERLTLGPDDILVIEGIHGLNDRLSYSLPKESKYKIYLSALTQLNIDEHNPLSTTDGRLLRRMVRDNRTRNTTAKQTIAMWPSVRKGEEENIFPYQDSADVMFNSSLIYELAVLKVYAEPLLFQIRIGEPEYFEAQRLLKFLDYLLPLPAEGINNNSLMREFVGGSCFNV